MVLRVNVSAAGQTLAMPTVSVKARANITETAKNVLRFIRTSFS